MPNVDAQRPTQRLPRLSTWIWAAFFLAALDRAQIAEGQTSQAVCTNASWTWSFNSKQQSPCLVAAYLLSPCSGGQFTVTALPPHQHYTNEKPNNCSCSTVVYSLLSACTGCQTDSPAPRWSSWQTNCTSSMVAIKKYPNDINPVAPVPAWAYLDVVTSDGLDLVTAMQTRLPESTVGNNQASTSSSSSSSTTTAAVSSTTQSSNTSAIVGGTVGGVLGLGLIVALIIFLLKQDLVTSKRHKRQAPSAAFARSAATPDVAAAAGFRSASRQANPNPLLAQPFTSGTSVGHGSSNHGHARGTSPVFQLGYTNGTPWSPPPPSSTPSGAVSPLSVQSLLMAQSQNQNQNQNYGGGGGGGGGGARFGGGSFEYPSSSVGHGTVDLLGHSGSMSSMRSTIPMMQYAGTPAPPVATTVPGPWANANTRPTHPYAGYGGYGHAQAQAQGQQGQQGQGHGRSGPHRAQFSGLPEM